jgi:hypothetical protein
MSVTVLIIAVVICFLVAVSAFVDARYADSDHPYGGGDKRDQP